MTPPVTPQGLLIASTPRLKGAPPEPSVAPPRVSETPKNPSLSLAKVLGTPITAPPPILQPPPGDLGVLIAATPRVKQEQPQPGASLVPVKEGGKGSFGVPWGFWGFLEVWGGPWYR